MLRFIALFFARVLILISGVGLLVSRAWGWSEYASPELYLVYSQPFQKTPDYFVANADGSGEGEALHWDDGGIKGLDCSPDGRMFAFLSGSGHFYVMTAAGLIKNSPVDRHYTTINVANDGTAALFDPVDMRVLVNDREINLATPGYTGKPLDQIDISAQGLVLWMQDFLNIWLVLPANGLVIPYIPHGFSGQWTNSGQMIVFNDQVTDPDGVRVYAGQYLLDMATQHVIRISDWTLSSPLSPDGTLVAAATPINRLNHMTQVAIFSLFGKHLDVVLTHDDKMASMPVCFLTFHPDLQIKAN